MAAAAGLEAHVIPGTARVLQLDPVLSTRDKPVEPMKCVGPPQKKQKTLLLYRHVWSAVKIAARWHLLDCTWCAGRVRGGTFVKRFSTHHWLTPPHEFAVDHLPDAPSLQFLATPLSTAQFFMQVSVCVYICVHVCVFVRLKLAVARDSQRCVAIVRLLQPPRSATFFTRGLQLLSHSTVAVTCGAVEVVTL